ncbi:winged helix-turn-helix transcriptional regulator [Haloferacaceae archaeon DSL9]
MTRDAAPAGSGAEWTAEDARALGASLSLTDAGLLSRQRYDEAPPRVEYAATPKAEALFPAFGRFHLWALEPEFDEKDDETRPNAPSLLGFDATKPQFESAPRRRRPRVDYSTRSP